MIKERSSVSITISSNLKKDIMLLVDSGKTHFSNYKDFADHYLKLAVEKEMKALERRKKTLIKPK